MRVTFVSGYPLMDGVHDLMAASILVEYSTTKQGGTTWLVATSSARGVTPHVGDE
jgi:hypothetical protein